jgi:hypothetical protein
VYLGLIDLCIFLGIGRTGRIQAMHFNRTVVIRST